MPGGCVQATLRAVILSGFPSIAAVSLSQRPVFGLGFSDGRRDRRTRLTSLAREDISHILSSQVQSLRLARM
jgi:hypothetical protein